MPTPQEHEIDGWKVRLLERGGDYPRFMAEAKHEALNKYAKCFGQTEVEVLTNVQERTGLDLQELLDKFGI